MHGPEPGKGSFYIELDLTNLLRPKNKGGGPKPCFMVGCLSRGGSLNPLVSTFFGGMMVRKIDVLMA